MASGDNIRVTVEGLEAMETALTTFKSNIISHCDDLDGAASSSASVLADEKSQTACKKISEDCEKIRAALDYVERALERIRDMIDRKKEADAAEM